MAIALPRLWPTFASGRRLGRYSRTAWPWPVTALFYLVLIGFSLLYGFAFGVFSGFSPMPFAAPLAILAILVVWAMPEQRSVPVRAISGLVTAFIIALLVWPDYIALAIGDLPWITAARLTGLPLMVLVFISYVRSPRFRAFLRDIVAPTREITWLLLGYFIMATVTIALSKDPAHSLSRYFVLMYTSFGVFFASLLYFNRQGRAYRFSILLVIATVISMVTGLYEATHSHLPWVGHIPSFLAIEDPRIETLLAGSARAVGGHYRVQSKFSTSIGLGEFLGMAIPFMVHLFIVTKSKLLKAFLLLLLPFIFYIDLETQSRLAFVCFMSAIILYILFRALIAWRDRPKSLFAPALALAYPLFMVLFFAATFAWHTLSLKVWGGGAEQFSTQSRKEQWARAWPLIGRNPIGHGTGESGSTLNYIAPGWTTPTVDSYYITVLLEVGVIGFLCFYGMFLVGIVRSGLIAIKTRDEEVMFLVAACIALTNFVLSKSVYSQTENHPLAFIILGMVVALVRRYKTTIGEAPPPLDADDLVRPLGASVTYRK